MAYDAKAQKVYQHPVEVVQQATTAAIESLGGKTKSAGNGTFEVNFNKKVKDIMMTNRCDLKIKIAGDGSGNTRLMSRAYPVDPMGNKLTFGVRSNAAQTVIDAFLEELPLHLPTND